MLREIRNSLIPRYSDLYYYKIPDTNPRFRQLNRFNPPRPFDVLLVYKGIPYALEAKLWKTGTSFPFASLTEPEEQGLADFQGAGGQSIVALGFRQNNQRKLYLSPYNIWKEIKLSLERQGRKSLPIDSLFLLDGYNCQWLKHGKWDIDLDRYG